MTNSDAQHDTNPEAEDDDEHELHDESDALPPTISSPSSPRTWLVIAGVCTALLAISWLAGARQLAPIEAASDGSVLVQELSFGQRLNGLGRSLVFLPLATLGLAFGMFSFAFVRQRPIGDAVALLARCAAVASITMLVWLAPIEVRFLKQSINLLGPPIVAGLVLIPTFRLSPRDAALATGFAILGLVLLTLFALVVVWAMSV